MPDARAAVARAIAIAGSPGVEPKHLFVAALDTRWGHQLLQEWGLEWERLEREVAGSGKPTGERFSEPVQRLMTYASRMAQISGPALDCAEQILFSLLINRKSLLARLMADQKADRRKAEEMLSQRLHAGEAWTEIDWREPDQLAADEGLPAAGESHYLRVVLKDRDSLGARVLEEVGTDLDRLLEAAAMSPVAQFTHPSPYLEFGRVESSHLAYAASHDPAVLELMTRLGVIPFRLHAAVFRAQPGMSRNWPLSGEDMHWLNPACQEALRLGATEVTEDHLVLGLLSDPLSTASRALEAAFGNLRELRRRLEVDARPVRVSPEEMRLSDGTRAVLEKACELADSKCPQPEHILLGLAENGPLGPVVDALNRLKKGALRSDLPVEIEGVSLGQSAEEVEKVAGAPLGREENSEKDTVVWSYGPRLSVGVRVGTNLVIYLSGDSLRQAGQVLLQVGDSLEKAESVLGIALETAVPGGTVWAYVNKDRVMMLSVVAD